MAPNTAPAALTRTVWNAGCHPEGNDAAAYRAGQAPGNSRIGVGLGPNPAELSGVLNKALQVVRDVLRNGITISPSMAAAKAEYRRMTDPVALWLDMETVNDPESMIPKEELLKAYNLDSSDERRPPITQEAFGAALKANRPEIQETQRRIDGSQFACIWVAHRRCGSNSAGRGARAACNENRDRKGAVFGQVSGRLALQAHTNFLADLHQFGPNCLFDRYSRPAVLFGQKFFAFAGQIDSFYIFGPRYAPDLLDGLVHSPFVDLNYLETRYGKNTK
jgi:hypothetical protein